MRNADVVLLTESQIAAINAALHAAAASNPCGEEQAARYEMLLDELLEEWGATSLRQLPASSFRHVLNWCAQQSLPDERGKFERHAQAALDRELVATKDRGTGMALGLLRLARGLDQQEVRHA